MNRAPTLSGEEPIVIAHRGASGYRPEHTLESYSLAIDMGADFIEPDLVVTIDGHLVARHDRYLGTTTDVADHPEFAGRCVEKPGHAGPEWFIEDFTLAEIRTLKAKQAFPGRSDEHDGRYDIPTFDQVLDLARRRSAELGRPIGVYPETKHPGYFKSIGLDFVEPLLAALEGFEGPVFIQSFESGILREFKLRTEHPLIMLVEMHRDGTPAITLETAAEVANGVGPHKELLRDPATHEPTDYVALAHALGLEVHPWTFRDDHVGPGFKTVRDELGFYLDQGIDGFFTDFADTGVSVLKSR